MRNIILGVDIGGSTTKIAALEAPDTVLDTLLVKAEDQLTSLYGAIGHLLYRCRLQLSDVSRIVLTGVGASWVEGDIYGIPTARVKEFEAIGRGALLLSGLDHALVISMGTGTAYVQADKTGSRHIGGSGVGGGTLVGLSQKLLGEKDIDAIVAMAEQGDLHHVDLSIGDISNADIPTLPSDVTASNFGRIQSTATKADLAAGLMNTIYQTAGMLAVFALREQEERNIVVTGSLAALPQAQPLLDGVGAMYGLQFRIPDGAPFATAIGAAAQYLAEQL